MGNNKTSKKPYLSPKIEHVYIVELEMGIAASSVTVAPGEANNTPSITDWEEEKNEQNWNF